MTASRNFDLAKVQAHAVKRGCTKEAIARFAERYPEHCRFRDDDGNPIGVVPRLRLALKLAQQGKGKFHLGRAGLFQVDEFQTGRKIFDIELPADAWNPEPYTIRILTSPAVDCVITVLPPEFRKDMHAKAKHRELRRIVDEEITEPEPEELKVMLPPPVKVGASLGDLLQAALRK